MKSQTLAALLASAATILGGEAPELEAASAGDRAAFDLLRRLEYLDGPADAVPHRVALLRGAARFKRIFSLRAEDAPGLVALGAEAEAGCLGVADAPTIGASGTGLNFREAFESCVGEGAEYLSSFATPDDPVIWLTAEEALAGASPGLCSLWQRLQPFRRDAGAAGIGWVMTANLADGAPAYLPADLCLRRPNAVRDLDPPWPLSTGCGAGADALSATLHGLLELIERDAVALWLRGGARPRVVPPGPGALMLGQLRGAVTTRRTWLLDITSDVGVPVIAAIACNHDGCGLSRGFACRPTLAAAADAALMELAQMELGYRLSATKRAVRGEAALNNIDRQHISRYTQLKVADTSVLHPLAPPVSPCDLLSYDRIEILAAVRKRLEAVGVEVYAMSLSRPALGIPVTRTLAPGLEIGLTDPPGERLQALALRSGVDLDSPVVL